MCRLCTWRQEPTVVLRVTNAMNHKKKETETKIRDVMTKDCPRLRVIKKSIMKLRTTPFLVRLSRKMSLTDVVAVL